MANFINDEIFDFNSKKLYEYLTIYDSNYIINNFDNAFKLEPEIVDIIITNSLYVKNTFLLEFILNNTNINVRARAISFLIKENRKILFKYYGLDFLDNLVNVELKYLSLILYNMFSNFNKELYEYIIDYTLTNYSCNDIALVLDTLYLEGNEYARDLLLDNIDTYFLTSRSYSVEIVSKYRKFMNDDIVKKFTDRYNCVAWYDEEIVKDCFSVGLGNTLLDMIDKYKCIGDSNLYGFVGDGTCATVFLAGDYVVKYSIKKYSEEPCPDIFLIHKNEEEYFVRDKRNKIQGVIEVQKYLTIPLDKDQYFLKYKFKRELKRLGYYLSDDLVEDNKLNCFYLNDYHDANCDDPEALPRWFKKNPIVLVDRDLVYKRK